jgi:hypothetical protein
MVSARRTTSSVQLEFATDFFGAWQPVWLLSSWERGCFSGNRSWERRDRLWYATVLSGDDDELNWSRRYKLNLSKLASGDLAQVMEVARDLAERDTSRGLSAGESECWLKHA